MGKENIGQRMFPKLNSSKEELKKILLRLEEPETSSVEKEKLTVLSKKTESGSRTCGLKSGRHNWQAEQFSSTEPTKKKEGQKAAGKSIL